MCQFPRMPQLQEDVLKFIQAKVISGLRQLVQRGFGSEGGNET